MTGPVFLKGMERLSIAFPTFKPDPKSIDAWFERLKNISDRQFNNSVDAICDGIKEIFPGTNIVALIRENIPRRVDGEKEATAKFLEGAEGFEGVVERIAPGKLWNVADYQPEPTNHGHEGVKIPAPIVACDVRIFDPEHKPWESCRYCGAQVDYYWVETDWLIRKWKQKQPFWLRIGCMACDERKWQEKNKLKDVGEEAYTPPPKGHGKQKSSTPSRKVIPFSSAYEE